MPKIKNSLNSADSQSNSSDVGTKLPSWVNSTRF